MTFRLPSVPPLVLMVFDAENTGPPWAQKSKTEATFNQNNIGEPMTPTAAAANASSYVNKYSLIR